MSKMVCVCRPSVSCPCPGVGCPWAVVPWMHAVGTSISFQEILSLVWGVEDAVAHPPRELSWLNQAFWGLSPLGICHPVPF